MREGPVAVVLSGFPRRSETFALGELLALERAGLLGRVFATKPGESITDAGAQRLTSRVEILPPGEPAEQAEVVIDRLRDTPPAAIHGYFAHLPAEVAMLAAQRLGVRYGFSVHARDARKATPGQLATRARAAKCVIACNADVAMDIQRYGITPRLLPHGVDLERFTALPLQPATPLRLLAVGRLVEKKGFLTLIEAAARLQMDFTLRIIGEGPEHERLLRAIETYGLAERVTLCGPMSHTQLPAEYAAAHIVVAPSIVDRSGDRDGLPNVVLEAMSSGRPVVASAVAAIATAVVHNETGLLVPPGDAAALADAVQYLASDGTLQVAMGSAGRHRVETTFEIGRCTARLIEVLRTAYGC